MKKKIKCADTDNKNSVIGFRNSISGVLKEQNEEIKPKKAKSVPVEVVINDGTIYIKPKGYGDCTSCEGQGIPIIVEIWNGELRVVAWPDINSEDSKKIIGLEGAQEKLYENKDLF